MILHACNSTETPQPTTVEESIQEFRIRLDTAGQITDTSCYKLLRQVAERVSRNADRVMLISCTENMNSDSAEYRTAMKQADAVKAYMLSLNLPRIYYNVGIEIAGDSMPAVPQKPEAAENRRIILRWRTID
jgi:hypothetical protein